MLRYLSAWSSYGVDRDDIAVKLVQLVLTSLSQPSGAGGEDNTEYNQGTNTAKEYNRRASGNSQGVHPEDSEIIFTLEVVSV